MTCLLINDLVMLAIIAAADHYRSGLRKRREELAGALKRWLA